MRAGLAVLCAGVVLSGSGSAAAQSSEGATAPELADQGYLECVQPDVRRKTCRSIGTYERIREGMYNSTTLIPAGNGVTLEIYTPVWLVDGAFCGSIREQDVLTATVRLNGREVPQAAADAALHQVLRQVRPFIDQEACTHYEPSGGTFVARTTIGGTHRPEHDNTVRMISSADGYRVAR
jgi:hypothetical protein